MAYEEATGIEVDCQMVLQYIMGSVSIYGQILTHDATHRLLAANEYLFVNGQDWRLIYDYSREAVLMVIASKPFKSTHYHEQP